VVSCNNDATKAVVGEKHAWGLNVDTSVGALSQENLYGCDEMLRVFDRGSVVS